MSLNGKFVFEKNNLTNQIIFGSNLQTGTSSDIALAHADAAQLTANTALTHADNAQVTADSGVKKGDDAQTAADTAKMAADTAKTAADTAQTKANTAQTTANGRLIWSGVYSGTPSYIKNNVVTYNQNLYVNILTSHNILPTNTTYWALLCDISTLQTSVDTNYSDISDAFISIDQCVKWKADYLSTNDYILNDAVNYNGSSYVNILPCNNILPTNTTYWTNLCPIAVTAFNNANTAQTTADSGVKKANDAQGSADKVNNRVNTLRDDLDIAIGSITTIVEITIPAEIFAYSLLVDAQFAAVDLVLAPTVVSVGLLDTVTIPAMQKGITDNGTAAADAMTRANSAYDHTVYEINTHYADTDILETMPIYTTVFIEEKLRNTIGVTNGAVDSANGANDRCGTLEGKTRHITANDNDTIFTSNLKVDSPTLPFNNVLMTEFSVDALSNTILNMAISGNIVSKGVVVAKTFGIQDQTLPLYNYTFYIDEFGNLTTNGQVLCNNLQANTIKGDTINGDLVKSKGILINLTELGLPALDINPSNNFASINEKTLLIGTLTPNNTIVIGSPTSTITMLGNINLNGYRGNWNTSIIQSDGDTVPVNRPSLNTFFTGNPLSRR